MSACEAPAEIKRLPLPRQPPFTSVMNPDRDLLHDVQDECQNHEQDRSGLGHVLKRALDGTALVLAPVGISDSADGSKSAGLTFLHQDDNGQENTDDNKSDRNKRICHNASLLFQKHIQQNGITEICLFQAVSYVSLFRFQALRSISMRFFSFLRIDATIWSTASPVSGSSPGVKVRVNAMLFFPSGICPPR